MGASDVPVVIPEEALDAILNQTISEPTPEPPLVDEGEPLAPESAAEEPAPEAEPATSSEAPPDLSGMLLDTLQQINERLAEGERAAAAEPEAEPEPDPIDTEIQSLLESDDTQDQKYGKLLQMVREENRGLRGELDQTRQVVVETQVQAVASKLETEITEVADRYGLDEKQVDAVVGRLEQGGLARVLTFEQGVRAFLPDARPKETVRRAQNPNGAAPGRTAPALITGSGAAGPAPRESAPKEYRSVEDAVADGYRRIFGGG